MPGSLRTVHYEEDITGMEPIRWDIHSEKQIKICN